MSRLLLALLKHLRLAVEGEADPPAPPDPTPASDPVDPPDDPSDDPLEDLLPPADPPPPPAQAAPAETQRERELRERLERVEAQAQRAPPPPVYHQQQRDPQDVAEEQFIEEQRRAGATQESLRWYQWQHDNNMRLRNAERIAQSAARSSHDAADASSFQALIADHPNLKRYSAAVEKHVRDNAAAGSPPVPRAVILRLVLGDAIVNAKPKAKVAAKPQTPGNPPPGRVDRGRAPGGGVRSDVSSRVRASERQALRDRLKDRLI